jgi:hypothetical protein
MAQAATTGNLESAQKIMIASARYTEEHNAPMMALTWISGERTLSRQPDRLYRICQGQQVRQQTVCGSSPQRRSGVRKERRSDSVSYLPSSTWMGRRPPQGLLRWAQAAERRALVRGWQHPRRLVW